jgi:PRTRC genetic system protein A
LKKAFEVACMDYRIGVGEGGVRALTHPVTYVLDQGGAWEVRKTPVGFVVKKAEKVGGVAGEGLSAGFIPMLPKIPFEIYRQVVAWFKAVNATKKAEAYVQVWWDPTAGQFYVHVPEQSVSGVSVKHTGEHDKDHALGHVHVLDLHSHNTMSAFFSGTDNADEQRIERLYGVVGKVEEDVPESKWRIRVGQAFMDLTFGDVWDLPQEQQFTIDVSLRQILEGTSVVVTAKLFEGVTFPEAWNAAIVERRGSTGSAPFHGGSYGGFDDDDPTTWYGDGWWSGEMGASVRRSRPAGGRGWGRQGHRADCNCAACVASRAKRIREGWDQHDRELSETIKRMNGPSRPMGKGSSGKTGREFFEQAGEIWERDDRTGTVTHVGRADEGWQGVKRG